MNKQREDFEKWAAYNGMGLHIFKSINKYADNDTEAAWQAWQQAKKVAVPEGFVLVPKEPTWEMINAGENACYGDDEEICKIVYKAMIEAQEQKND